MGTILKVENVTKRFGGLVALDDVSFEVERGQIFGIIGPNGAGKTTLFNVITGVYSATSGSVYFKNESIDGKPVHEIAAMGISRTFQNIKLLSEQTLLDNVMLGRHNKIKSNFIQSILRTKREQKEEQESLEFCMEILDFLGLSNRWNLPAGSFPYGEQRLIEIARALATEPDLIFLDEPAAGMNPAESSRLIEIVRAIAKRGITPIVVEHDMKVIMTLCDEIIVLNHGVKICNGSPEKVKNDPQVIEAYLGREVDFDAGD